MISDIPAPLPSDLALDLAAAYAVCEGATPGPWVPYQIDDQPVREVWWNDSGDLKFVARCNQFRGPAGDTAFIALSRTALPSALRLLAAARREVEGLKAALAAEVRERTGD